LSCANKIGGDGFRDGLKRRIALENGDGDASGRRSATIFAIDAELDA
jgi:hypothetical protein